MGRFVVKLFALALSIALYGVVVYFLVAYFLKSERIKKIEIKGEAIDVMIETPEPKKPKLQPQPKPKPKRVATAKPKPKSGSTSPKPVQNDLKRLFASLDAKKYTSKKITHKPPKNTPSRKRGSRAQAKKLLKDLKFKEIELDESKKSIKAISGEEDAYLQRVYKILYENWIPSRLSAGSWAKVEITIDMDGKIRYRVLEWAQNEVFNQELRSYLEYLTSLTFPIPTKERTFVVRFEAKE